MKRKFGFLLAFVIMALTILFSIALSSTSHRSPASAPVPPRPAPSAPANLPEAAGDTERQKDKIAPMAQPVPVPVMAEVTPTPADQAWPAGSPLPAAFLALGGILLVILSLIKSTAAAAEDSERVPAVEVQI